MYVGEQTYAGRHTFTHIAQTTGVEKQNWGK